MHKLDRQQRLGVHLDWCKRPQHLGLESDCNVATYGRRLALFVAAQQPLLACFNGIELCYDLTYDLIDFGVVNALAKRRVQASTACGQSNHVQHAQADHQLQIQHILSAGTLPCLCHHVAKATQCGGLKAAESRKELIMTRHRSALEIAHGQGVNNRFQGLG